MKDAERIDQTVSEAYSQSKWLITERGPAIVGGSFFSAVDYAHLW